MKNEERRIKNEVPITGILRSSLLFLSLLLIPCSVLTGEKPLRIATFEVDISVTEKLAELVPTDVVLVSESGYKTVEDVVRANQAGVDAILVGEALMRREITIEQLRAV